MKLRRLGFQDEALQFQHEFSHSKEYPHTTPNFGFSDFKPFFTLISTTIKVAWIPFITHRLIPTNLLTRWLLIRLTWLPVLFGISLTRFHTIPDQYHHLQLPQYQTSSAHTNYLLIWGSKEWIDCQVCGWSVRNLTYRLILSKPMLW